MDDWQRTGGYFWKSDYSFDDVLFTRTKSTPEDEHRDCLCRHVSPLTASLMIELVHLRVFRTLFYIFTSILFNFVLV